MKQLPQGQYNFKDTENKILKFWHSGPFFKPEFNPKTRKLDSFEKYMKGSTPKWTLVCPPPNAYDRPHMGNLSGYQYMDAMGRFQRMLGKRVLLIPGKDHAGIEGEVSYIKYFLEPQGKSKFDFTREEFFNQVYQNQQHFIRLIRDDEQRVGLSADFDRDLYTMDPKVINEVLSTFVQMYKDGLIYRGVRIVNWDTKSQSAISDSQCERKKVQGKLYYIKYPLVSNPLGIDHLVIATTRPETMLGDTGVVVNPTDDRYKSLVGYKAVLPLVNREIPIITSGRVEKDFGTGVLKLTPAHASEDYEIMLEWNKSQEGLPDADKVIIDYVNVIDHNARLCGPIPEKYKGLTTKEAREVIVEDLISLGLLVKEEEITQNISVSERTGAIIEPLMASQWFISVSKFKQRMIDILNTGELRIYPKYAANKYISWVTNLRDWAISRNLWWGYRLPVWYRGVVEEFIDDTGKVRVRINIGGDWEDLDPNNPDHMRVQIESPGDGWIQDENILDTWFSSGQWPLICLSTHGLMDAIYPTDVLVSGYDLLIKWDLFMILFGIYKTKKPPFKNLYLTGLVKGTDGQKMSKSRGNFVPIDKIIENYGVDAFRMNCYYQNRAGRDYAITESTLKTFRNFNNKIWNASKFVMMNIQDLDISSINSIKSVTELRNRFDQTIEFRQEDLDMLDHIDKLYHEWHSSFENFRFGRITEKLYASFWHTFCDVYLESVKSRVKVNTGDASDNESSRAAQIVLFYSLKSYLKMLHPFIPFLTEEIWQHLVEDGKYEIPMMYSEYL
ncbi:MAG: valine--tRNA ligase [Candidatus Dojkabacteria bacterium]|nr:MAG: valine--tRNA ligase [Candidatus Dojkabacteria bacterium]